MNSIVFASPALEQLWSGLIGMGPQEAAALLLAGHVRTESGLTLLVREVIPVPQEAYLDREEYKLTIAPAFIAGVLKRARLEDLSVVLVHTHPFDDSPRFSSVDDRCEDQLLPVFMGRAANRPHGTLVLGRHGFDGRLYDPDLRRFKVAGLKEIGREVTSHGGGTQEHVDRARDDRNIRAFGADGQRVIGELRIGVVGLGGTGSFVASELAHLGVKDFILVDSDIVDVSNLNRLVGAGESDIGRAKVDVARKYIHQVSPATKVRAIAGSVFESDAASSLLSTDVIMCCTDSHGSRALLNQIAYQYYIPTIDMGVRIDSAAGSIVDVAGRVQLLAPTMPCLVCQSLLDPEEVRRDYLSADERRQDPYIVGDPQPSPSVVSLNGVVSSLAVTMLLSIVARVPLRVRHQIYRAIDGSVRGVAGTQRDDCIICSVRGVLGRGDTWRLPVRSV